MLIWRSIHGLQVTAYGCKQFAAAAAAVAAAAAAAAAAASREERNVLFTREGLSDSFCSLSSHSTNVTCDQNNNRLSTAHGDTCRSSSLRSATARPEMLVLLLNVRL
jgi:hypothetical protein